MSAKFDGSVGTSQSRRSRELSAVVLVCAMYASLPTFASLITDGRRYDLENTTSSVVLTSFSESLREPLLILVVAVCALILAKNVVQAFRRRPEGLVLLAFPVLMLVGLDVVQGAAPNASAFLVLMVGATIWSIGPRVNDLRMFGTIGFFVALISLAMAVVYPDAWQIDEEKGMLGEAVLAGPFSQMNILGMVLAVLLPFVTLFQSRLMRWGAGLAIALTLVLASSRTSLLAGGIALFGMLMIRVTKGHRARKRMLILSVIVVVGVATWLPFFTTDRQVFTNRGAIWINAREFLADSIVVGHGLDTFRFDGPLFQLTHSLAAHGHNLVLHYLSVAGLFGGIALVLMLIPALRSSLRAAVISTAPAGGLLAILGLGIAEVSLRIETFDGPAWATWTVFLALFFLQPSDETSDLEASGERRADAPNLPARRAP